VRPLSSEYVTRSSGVTMGSTWVWYVRPEKKYEITKPPATLLSLTRKRLKQKDILLIHFDQVESSVEQFIIDISKYHY